MTDTAGRNKPLVAAKALVREYAMHWYDFYTYYNYSIHFRQSKALRPLEQRSTKGTRRRVGRIEPFEETRCVESILARLARFGG